MVLIHETDKLSLDEHPLAWMIARPDFKSNVLASVVAGYLKYQAIPKATRCAAGGVRRYGWITDELYEMYKAEFGATAKAVGGQARIIVHGPGNQCAQIVARRGYLDEPRGGFVLKAKPGKRTRDLSLLSEDLPIDPSWGTKTGLLIAHYPEDDNEKIICAWIAHRWKAKTGAKFVPCEEAVFLGKIAVDRKNARKREETGDVVDL